MQYVEKLTILDVFNAVPSETAFGVIPQENSIFGTVTETYDLLRLPALGNEKFVRGELAHAVRHSLLVRTGVKLEDVRRVMSHEQALGQCSKFLADSLPEAARVKMPSTSAAAQALLSETEEDDALHSAAICSSLCAEVFGDLVILQEDIQDNNNNSTRFYVLANSLNATLPSDVFRQQPRRRALVRITERLLQEESSPRARVLQLILSTLLTTFGSPAVRIDRRPRADGLPGQVYIIELEDSTTPPTASDLGVEDTSWLARIQCGIQRIQVSSADATLLGIW